MRTGAVLASALLIAGALVGLAAEPAAACTCGALVDSGGSVTSPTTRAVISWDDGVETIELAATASGTEGTVGLIVPTPARASVSAGDPTVFEQLDSASTPKQIAKDDWWGRSGHPAPAVAATPPVATLASKHTRVGDSKAVARWAKKNGLTLDKATSAALDGYGDTGWSLSLVTLTAPRADGELSPVRLSFHSTLPVYPMLLSASSSTPVDLRLYLLRQHRSELVQNTRGAPPLDAAQAVVWAGSTAGGPAASLGRYLTVIDLHLDDPAKQVASDIRVVDAPSDDAYLPERLVVNRITVLGLPLGWVLSAWGGLGVLAGIIALATRLRAR